MYNISTKIFNLFKRAIPHESQSNSSTPELTESEVPEK